MAISRRDQLGFQHGLCTQFEIELRPPPRGPLPTHHTYTCKKLSGRRHWTRGKHASDSNWDKNPVPDSAGHVEALGLSLGEKVALNHGLLVAMRGQRRSLSLI
jgi:hypothetical protein